MRIRYPALQNVALDQEDENHHLVPGAWRDDTDLADLERIGRGNQATVSGKRQRLYLKHYYASEAGSVPW